MNAKTGLSPLIIRIALVRPQRSIRNQTIRRHPQRVDSAFELADNVLLVTTVIGEENNLLRSHLSIVGDIEEVPYVVE